MATDGERWLICPFILIRRPTLRFTQPWLLPAAAAPAAKNHRHPLHVSCRDTNTEYATGFIGHPPPTPGSQAFFFSHTIQRA